MILEQITEIIVNDFHIKAENVTAETSLKDDLNLDSLDSVELVMALEDKFNVSIPDSDAMSFKTVGDVVNYIEAQK